MNITDPVLTAREGAAVLQISIPTFWRRVADGTIPKPVKLGGLSRWPQSEVLAGIEHAKTLRGKPPCRASVTCQSTQITSSF